MRIPLQITYQDIDRSDALDAEIRRRVAALESLCDDIGSCRVRVIRLAAHQRQGRPYALHVNLKLPGEDIVVSRERAHEDVYVATRDALNAAQRRLEDYVRRRRGQVKSHASAPPPGAVAEDDQELVKELPPASEEPRT